jgi:hypothetical protein
MDAFSRKRWISVAILLGVLYFVVGVGFGVLANTGVSDQVRFMWRLGAWAASAVVYAAHISYEHFRLGNSSRTTALHAGMAVALGGFLLAVAATVHSMMVPSHAPYWRYLIALVAWPIITGLPAFLVALTMTAVLARLPTKRLAQ